MGFGPLVLCCSHDGHARIHSSGHFHHQRAHSADSHHFYLAKLGHRRPTHSFFCRGRLFFDAGHIRTQDRKSCRGELDLPAPEIDTTSKPGEWLENNGLLTVLVCTLGLAYLARLFFIRGPLVALDLNTYNFLFIMLGMLLHWKPRAFVRAVSAAVPATAGVLIQFPFYSGIFGLMTKSPLSSRMAGFFVGISSHGSYPVLLTIYSAILGLFVPSGGSKWIIEAPYVLAAAKQLHVNLGWVVQVYNTAEALPNLINPFWMLPLLGILNIRAREVIGYSSLYLIVNFPLVLLLMWLFARIMPYAPPGAFSEPTQRR